MFFWFRSDFKQFVRLVLSVRDTAYKLGWDKKYNEEINYYTIDKLLENKKINVTSTHKYSQTPFMYYI